jgi:hypothetical protein
MIAFENALCGSERVCSESRVLIRGHGRILLATLFIFVIQSNPTVKHVTRIWEVPGFNPKDCHFPRGFSSHLWFVFEKYLGLYPKDCHFPRGSSSYSWFVFGKYLGLNPKDCDFLRGSTSYSWFSSPTLVFGKYLGLNPKDCDFLRCVSSVIIQHTSKYNEGEDMPYCAAAGSMSYSLTETSALLNRVYTQVYSCFV